MNIEEARKVVWLKSNPRPLGELLDEGYLTKERLQWAAQWAYNPQLKEAAKVLLEHRESQSVAKTKAPFEVGISLEKARAMPWPFPPHKGQPMGMLVESRQLSLKDLGYAVENAWDQKVRQAAIALSLVRLEQAVKEPPASSGYVHLISGGKSYSERRQLALSLIQGLIMGVLLGLGIFFIVTSFGRASTPNPNAKPLSSLISSPAGIIALVIILVIIVVGLLLENFILNFVTKQIDKQIEEYSFGQEGEDRVVQSILQILDGNWHLFQNIYLPGRNKGDLDLVLVGPPGIWYFEVKNYRGEYRNIGDTWEYKHRKGWKKAASNPSQQAQKYAYRLKNFLKADGLNVFINSVVIWANPEASLTVDNPMVAVWRYNQLPEELGNIWQIEKITSTERQEVVEKLSRLSEDQRKKLKK